MCSDGCVRVTMWHGEVLWAALLPFGSSTQLVFFFVSVGLSYFLMEDFVVAVDDVKLEQKFVKEVVEVLATAGLAAPQHLAGTPISMIEKLVVTCSVAAGGLLKRSFQTADDVSVAKRLKASNGAPGATHTWQVKVCSNWQVPTWVCWAQKLLQGQLQGQ